MQEFIQLLRGRITSGNILEREPMSRHTTFSVGGPADLFVQPGSVEEVQWALKCSRERKVPFFVVGNGSNLLVSDEGFRGMILNLGKNFQEIRVEGETMEVQAGALLSRTAREALNHGLSGLEFAAGIPGSMGGAAAMNAGAYGGEMKDVITEVLVLTEEGQLLNLSNEEMDLGYRHSCIFEKNYIVLQVKLKLHRGSAETIRARMDELARARREKQPLEYPSAGSTFKRPAGYFAGKLIQDAGLKGFRVGGAMVSDKHAGFVINVDHGTASDIAEVIRQVQIRVKKDFGVTMHPEVRFLGFSHDQIVR